MSADQPTCPKCRAKVRASDKFCPYCSVKLDRVVIDAPVVDVAAATVTVIDDRPDGTGQDQLLAAASYVFGGPPELFPGCAVWRRADHLIVLSLRFSELGRGAPGWDESGRGFELVLRVSAMHEWIAPAFDTLLEHTFTVQPGSRVRLATTLWCETRAEPGLERLQTLNGTVRVLEAVSPFDRFFGEDDASLVPPHAVDSENERHQLIWVTDQHVISLCDDVMVIDGIVSRGSAEARFRSRLEDILPVATTLERRMVVRPARPGPIVGDDTAFFGARDDLARARVFRDWLIERGDPRGELAAWIEADRSDELNFFWQHDRDTVLGDVPIDPESFEWTHGFVDGLTITGDPYTDELARLVERTLALPFFSTARRLRLGATNHDHLATWKAITSSPIASRLISLELNQSDDLDFYMTSVEDLSELWPRLPSLQRLLVRGTEGTFGRIEHERLSELTIEATHFSAERAAELKAMRCPDLRSFTVWTGPETDLSVLSKIFSLRGLTHFGLVNCDVTHDALEMLVDSPLFESLETLDLSRGALIDDDVERILKLVPLRRLKRIDVNDNLFTEAAVKRLRAALPSIHSVKQRKAFDFDEDDAGRYVSVSE